MRSEWGLFNCPLASLLQPFDLKGVCVSVCVCGLILEWEVMKYNTTSRCRASGLPQDKSFKSDRDALSQTTLKTCLLPKWIWGERNEVFEAGPVIRRL